MSFTAQEVASWIGGQVANSQSLGAALGAIRVDRPAPLASAGASDLAFFFSKAYQHEVPLTKAGILVTGTAFVKPLEAAGLPLWSKTAVIACEDPYLALGILSGKFAARLSSVAHLERPSATEIHPTAVVHPTAELAEGVRVGAGSVVEERARIGAGTVIYPGCYVGPRASIGEDCVLFPRVTVYEWTEIGNRVRIHAGSVIGADGFGYAPRTAKQDGQPRVEGHQKIFHLGKVVIRDDVEIGANTCVDRGTFDDTILEKSVKLDNQVQIGHNARIGEGTIICGATAVAGSVTIGKFAYIGGNCGIAKCDIGDYANIGACSLIAKDIPAGGKAVGNPQREYSEHFRAHAALNRLVKKGRSRNE